MWQYTKTLEQLNDSMYLKFDNYHEGLVLTVPLDEGMGLTTEGHFYTPLPVDSTSDLQTTTAVNTTTVQFLIHSSESPGWAPSGVYMTPSVNYSIVFRNATLKEHAMKLCYEQFYGGVLQEHCTKTLVSQALFFYESCLTDVADSGSLTHHKLSVSLFGLYCQRVLGIPECLLHGTYDAFPKCPIDTDVKENVITIAEIIVTTVSSLLFLLFLLIIIIVVCRRRKKRKSRVERIYLEDPKARPSLKYAYGEDADHPHACMMRALDTHDVDSDEGFSPPATSSFMGEGLVRNPGSADEGRVDETAF